MDTLSDKGQEIARAAAERHGVSAAAAAEMLRALAASGGTQAQFSHPELGGMGQWSRGGMLMIGDMFNNALKSRVDALATDLAEAASGADVLRAGSDNAGLGGSGSGGSGMGNAGSGWPAEFGTPASSGSQNDMRYAFFPEQRRLVIARNGVNEVYDSGDHVISGVGQAQGGAQTISFSTGRGPLPLSELRRIDQEGGSSAETERASGGPTPRAASAPARSEAAAPAGGAHDVLGTIDRLAELRARGVLTDEEFAAKKAELLSRL